MTIRELIAELEEENPHRKVILDLGGFKNPIKDRGSRPDGLKVELLEVMLCDHLGEPAVELRAQHNSPKELSPGPRDPDEDKAMVHESLVVKNDVPRCSHEGCIRARGHEGRHLVPFDPKLGYGPG